MTVTLRPRAASDTPALLDVFHQTLALGRPLPFPFPLADAYAELCLGWYLERSPSWDQVVEVDGQVGGYVLVCTDQGAFERWQLAAGYRYLRRVAAAMTSGQLRGDAARFVWLRLLDGFDAWREADPGASGVHAHFNLLPAARGGLVVGQLVEHIDAVCRRVGARRWSGQINSLAGSRRRVLAEYGWTLLAVTPNRTLSWLAGAPVERLTVERQVGELRRTSAVAGGEPGTLVGATAATRPVTSG